MQMRMPRMGTGGSPCTIHTIHVIIKAEEQLYKYNLVQTILAQIILAQGSGYITQFQGTSVFYILVSCLF